MRGNLLENMKIAREEIAVFCRDLFDQELIGVDFPAGKDRKTGIAHLPDRSIVVSKRASVSRAKLEALVLDKLSPTGLTPSLIGQRGDMLAQEMVTGSRLSRELELGSGSDRESLLVLAGSTLLALLVAGWQAGLTKHAPTIGEREGWFLDFARSPLRLAQMINVDPPVYNVEAMAEEIISRKQTFVKWDARPGNAHLTSQRSVSWFDWEHCGCGSTEDDLVWMLADEWAPIHDGAVETLLRRAALTHSIPFDELSDRFRKKAILHSTVRLALIFSRKGGGPWWDVQSSMDFDRVGVSLSHVRRVCRRARRWSVELGGCAGLAAFFEVTERFAESI